MGKPIIVGYDPGTTAALAILDTSGNILYLKSKKEFLRKEIVEEITKRGKPIIIASDKNSLSKNVEKLASSLGCKAFNPVEDLSNLEKYNIIKNYLDVVKNDHERDALASALKAHRSYSDLFKKTDKTISFLGLSEFYGEIVNALIQKEAKNINEAINFVLNDIRIKKEKFIENKKGQFEKITPKETENLRNKIKGQENDINILKKYNETLKQRLEKVDEKFKNQRVKAESFQDKKTIEENERIHKLENELEKREIVIEKLKIFRKLENKEYTPIFNLDKIDLDKLRLLNGMFDLENRVLSTNNPINIQFLNEYNIQALITLNIPEKKILERLNFPLIDAKEIEIKEIDNISVVKKNEFNEKLKKARKLGIIQWVNGYKKRRL